MGVENTFTTWTGSVGTRTISVTVAADSNRKLVLKTAFYDTASDSVTVTFDPGGGDEASFTEIVSSPYSGGSSLYVHTFYLDEADIPAGAGTYDVQIDWIHPMYQGAGAVIYLADMASGAPSDGQGDYDTSTATHDVTVTANTGDTVLDMGIAIGSETPTPDSGQTEYLETNVGSFMVWASYATNEDTMGWTLSSTATAQVFASVWNAAAASSIIPQISHHSNIILG